MAEENAVESVETTETIDWEQRARKAEAKIVDMKKSVTPEEKKEETPETPKEEVNAIDLKEQVKKEMALDSFIDSNPDFAEKRGDIEKLTSNGLTFDEAKDILIKRDPTFAERQKTNSMSMNWDFSPWITKNTYSAEDLGKLNPDEYKQVYKLKEEWKVKFV